MEAVVGEGKSGIAQAVNRQQCYGPSGRKRGRKRGQLDLSAFSARNEGACILITINASDPCALRSARSAAQRLAGENRRISKMFSAFLARRAGSMPKAHHFERSAAQRAREGRGD